MFSNKRNEGQKDYMADPIHSQKQSMSGWQIALLVVGGVWVFASLSSDEAGAPCLPEHQGCISGLELPEELPLN